HRREPSCPTTSYVEALLAAVDGTLQLRLRHPRAPWDVPPLGLVVELLLRAALRAPRAGSQSTAATGGHVAGRTPRTGSRFAGAGPFLVDGARRDLLRALRRAALLLLGLLDVLVLAFALRVPC